MPAPTTPEFQMLPGFNTPELLPAPLACEGCDTPTFDLDQNHQGCWLCPECFMGVHAFGMGQQGW